MLIDATGAQIYKNVYGWGYHQYYSEDPIYTVLDEDDRWYLVRHHSLNNGVTGLFKKCDVRPYNKKENNNNIKNITVNIFIG